MKKYEAREGAPFKKEVAQAYGDRLDYIASQNKGKITPSRVVDDATQSTSPFHDYFEWDNKKASDEYRLHQARMLINHIVELVVIEGVQSKQKSYFSVRNGGGKLVYVNLKTAVTKTSYRDQLLGRLISTMENATELMKMFKGN